MLVKSQLEQGYSKSGNTLSVDAAPDTNNILWVLSGTGTWQGTAVADGYLGTGINAIKLADGTVTNTELQYINSLSSNAQTQNRYKGNKRFSR